jgi:23S rRNA (adenine2503-C2)-methyltransferase
VSLVALHPHDASELAVPPARALAERLRREAGLWCVPHGALSARGRDLQDVRQGGPARMFRRIEAGELEALAPDDASPERRASRGLTCVGAHGVVVSLSVELATGELRVARRIAGQLQLATGGLPAVTAQALRLAEDRVEVAMSLVDHRRTSPATAHEWVARLAAEEGVDVVRSELTGCVPAAAWPPGTGRHLAEPDLVGEEERRRLLESWLPGGALGTDPGLAPRDLPEPAAQPVPRPGAREPDSLPIVRLLDLPIEAQRRAIALQLQELGERSFRTGQVLSAIWKGHRRSFDDMTDLPRPLRSELGRRLRIGLLEPAQRAESADGTVKYLWRLPDGLEVESVSIPSARRTTFCLSCQVGCTLKCRFCATGHLGFNRNLSAGEIVDQALAMLADQGLSSDSLNVVFMGQGEPGHALAPVLDAVKALNDPAGLEVGARRITVSTSGVVPAIRALGDFPLQVRLAVSLHAADQELRESLMNVAKKHPLEDLRAACRAYHAVTRRRITFEYCLLPGINDGEVNARLLARFAGSVPSKVNLIPYNPVAQFPTEAATPESCRRFQRQLVEAGFGGEISVREPRGRDIEAACGMLHRHRGEQAAADEA